MCNGVWVKGFINARAWIAPEVTKNTQINIGTPHKYNFIDLQAGHHCVTKLELISEVLAVFVHSVMSIT